MSLNYNDQQIKTGLAAGDRKVYEFIFRKYYVPLCRFCLKYVRTEAVSEEVVQEVFIYLWEKRTSIQLQSSIQSYIYAAVRNRSINYIRSQVTKEQHLTAYQQAQEFTTQSPSETDHKEALITMVRAAIDSLPNKCKLIFSLSRDAGLTYQEIAEEMQISQKTVEAQMSIALKKLRSFIRAHKDHILFWIIIISWL